jgi:hypothetical protein
MSRRALLPLLVVACALVGVACGSSDPTPAAVRAFRLPAPYLPPPDPSSYRAQAHAPTPTTTAPGHTAPGTTSGAPSDAQVRADLRKAYGGAGATDLDQATIGADGLAQIPDTAPPKLVALMHAANDVARKPYVYGGGHGRVAGEIWTDSAYDCSGSVSYALASAGYLDGPMVSGDLARWGRPGPGKWVTIFANGGHAFMVVAGLRFDTSGAEGGTRWQPDTLWGGGYVARHPLGL